MVRLCMLGCMAQQAIAIAQAEESLITEPVVGHKPTAENVRVINSNPVLGDTLNVSYDYGDVDGDVEGDTAIKWLYNGNPVAGQTAKDYTPQLDINTAPGQACTDFQVAAEVIPVSLGGDPLIGDTKQSEPVTVKLNLPLIPDFTFPDTTTRTWHDANAFCQAQGMSLPSRGQLTDLHASYASGGGYELAEKYGWPIVDRCGGRALGYWTREVTGANHWAVVLYNGSAISTADTTLSHVTCLSRPAQLPTAVALLHPASGTAALNGAGFTGRPVVTVDQITAALTFVANTDSDLSNYRFEWFAGEASTGVIKDGDNTFTPRVADQGKPIHVVVTLKP